MLGSRVVNNRGLLSRCGWLGSVDPDSGRQRRRLRPTADGALRLHPESCHHAFDRVAAARETARLDQILANAHLVPPELYLRLDPLAMRGAGGDVRARQPSDLFGNGTAGAPAAKRSTELSRPGGRGGLGPVHTSADGRMASTISAKWMNAVNMTSSLSKREKIRRKPFSRRKRRSISFLRR